INVVRLDDHITEVDANAEDDALVLRRCRIVIRHLTLNHISASNRVDHAGELREYTIAGSFYDPATMFADFWIEPFAKMRFDTFVRAFLIGSHEARVTHHICGENGGKASGGGHSWFTP